MLNAHRVISIGEYVHPKDEDIATAVRVSDGSDTVTYFVEQPYDTVIDRTKQSLA